LAGSQVREVLKATLYKSTLYRATLYIDSSTSVIMAPPRSYRNRSPRTNPFAAENYPKRPGKPEKCQRTQFGGHGSRPLSSNTRATWKQSRTDRWCHRWIH